MTDASPECDFQSMAFEAFLYAYNHFTDDESLGSGGIAVPEAI
jgi:hypothetical protein